MHKAITILVLLITAGSAVGEGEVSSSASSGESEVANVSAAEAGNSEDGYDIQSLYPGTARSSGRAKFALARRRAAAGQLNKQGPFPGYAQGATRGDMSKQGDISKQDDSPGSDFANIRKQIMVSEIRSMDEGESQAAGKDGSRLSELIAQLKGMNVGEFKKLDVAKSADIGGTSGQGEDGGEDPNGVAGGVGDVLPGDDAAASMVKDGEQDEAAVKGSDVLPDALAGSAGDGVEDSGYAEQGDAGSEDEMLEKLLAQRVENGRAIDIADALYESGQIEKAAVFYRSAEKYLQEKLDAGEKVNHYDRQWCLFQLGNCLDKTKPVEAGEVYGKLVRSYPDSYWAHAAKIRKDILEWRQEDETSALIERYKFKTGN